MYRAWSLECEDGTEDGCAAHDEVSTAGGCAARCGPKRDMRPSPINNGMCTYVLEAAAALADPVVDEAADDEGAVALAEAEAAVLDAAAVETAVIVTPTARQAWRAVSFAWSRSEPEQAWEIHALVLSMKVCEWQTQVKSVALSQPPRSGFARQVFAQPDQRLEESRWTTSR